ncbi:Holliday junction resolvase RuvX [Candidatus Microgenomates bacterium]|nr:MAG: Holliday junction resolvase RuvX [Candidatus Microgenomates bacterium]
MSFLGVDYGRKYSGIAFAQRTQADSLQSVPTKLLLSEINRLCKKLDVQTCVVGVPEGAVRQEVLQFIDTLSRETSLRVVGWDETLTTYQARDVLQKTGKSAKRRKENEHAVAAALMLQSYLDSQTYAKKD